MIEWIREHQALVWSVAGGFSLASFVGTLVGLPWLVARLPADYFRDESPPPGEWRRRHPAVRLAILAAKNLVGAILLVAGVAMLVLPGQGLLTIMMSLVFLNFPGKRRLERFLVTRRPIRRAIGWIRTRAGRAPLELPDTAPEKGTGRPPDRGDGPSFS